MPGRSALLICCSVEEIHTIRTEAENVRRPLSNYMVNTVMRAVIVDEKLTKLNGVPQFGRAHYDIPVRPPGARTAILLRCSNSEAKRIRASAKRKQLSISGFVLQCLRRSWNLKTASPTLLSKPI